MQALHFYKGYEEYTLEDYTRMMNVNVQAPFFTIQASAEIYSRRRQVITIGSCLADRVSSGRCLLYIP